MKTKYKHIHFELEEKKEKTQVWEIHNNTKDEYLGIIEWYFPWRQYCSCTEDVFLSRGCHLDIGDFIEQLMKEHKIKHRG